MNGRNRIDIAEERARSQALTDLIARIPYARFLGITIDRRGDEITTTLNFDEKLIGNPVLPALHGGVIGAFMEVTAIAQLAWTMPGAPLPKPIDISVDYLRSGRPMDTFARAIIAKPGRRVANVRVEAWQDERARPIAALHGHFLLRRDEESGTGD